VKLELSLVRTKVARNMLALFLLCAVAPVLTFAALSYREVGDGLTEQARDNLKDESRMSAMVVRDALANLGNALGAVALGKPAKSIVSDSLGFGAVVLRRPSGTVERRAGDAFAPPRLDARQLQHLQRDVPLLVSMTGSSDPSLLFAVRTPEGELWGRVPLRQFEAGIETAAGGDELCILDHDGSVISCPDTSMRAVVIALGREPGTTKQWKRDGRTMMSANASLFLVPEFGAVSWSVSLTTPLATAMLPLAEFRKSFILGVLLAVILVFTVSHIQIRRRMAPLAHLEDGTRRLRAGDFTTRVVVTSDDEFRTLAGSFNQMAGELQRQFDELKALSVGSLTALARTIDASSPWTGGHSERVTQCAVEIGRRMGLDEQDCNRLHDAGLLHDIGKIGIPTAILDKGGRLTDEELTVMQTHPGIGADIVQTVHAFRDLVPMVRHHHELLDGTGYPDGLRGDQIPMLVRVLTVADVYDALVSDRPYRAGMAPSVALTILQDGAGSKFDLNAVEILGVMVGDQWKPSDTREAAAVGTARGIAADVVWEATFV